MLSSDLFKLAAWFGDAPGGVRIEPDAAAMLAEALRKAARDAVALERRAGIDNVITLVPRTRVARGPNPWAGPTDGGDVA